MSFGCKTHFFIHIVKNDVKRYFVNKIKLLKINLCEKVRFDKNLNNNYPQLYPHYPHVYKIKFCG